MKTYEFAALVVVNADSEEIALDQVKAILEAVPVPERGFCIMLNQPVSSYDAAPSGAEATEAEAVALSRLSGTATLDGKRDFILDLWDACKDVIFANLRRVPESWDGLELRQYIIDKTTQACGQNLKDDHKARFKAYKAVMLKENL